VALLAGFGLLLAVSVREQPPWVAVALGTGFVTVAADLTNYYWSILVVYALMCRRHAPLGFALCALSAVGWIIEERFLFMDEIFTWLSLAGLGFVVFATAWVWWRPATHAGAPQAAGP
jgi:hypothetical protein